MEIKMKYGLIGEHLGHSFSKVIHSMIADYEYELLELRPDEVAGFMKAKAFAAINVTIPYKEAVMPYLDFISERARAIGSVNTVVNRDGKLYGYNTDFYGMTGLIESLGIEIKGKKVLICGTGGTSKTALAVCESLGAREIHKLSRRAERDRISYGEAYEKHTDADVIINTTPVGMYPNIGGSPIDISTFPRLSGTVDAVYNPLRTQLISDGLERGIPSGGGLYMLVAQAVAACEIFLDKKLDGDITDKVYKRILADKENIVLVGMPGCGKSTIGKMIAETLNRPFYDLDTEIVKDEGREIPDIFAKDGEGSFRDIESRVLFEKLAPVSGSVIATGGGAILREENVRALKLNGRLYFLNRPLCQLLPTPDRPTASSKETIEKRYAERLPIYKRVADTELLTDGIADHAVADIIKLHFGE